MNRIGILILFAVVLIRCKKEDVYHLKTDDTYLPILVSGNTDSNIFLLHIEGGPGSSSFDGAYANVLKWKQDLEQDFGTVYYDQRGMGNASGTVDVKDFSLSRFVDDLDLVVQFIYQQYPYAKIFLVGNSWGGFLGTAYLLATERQQKIQGWISITGAITYDFDERWQYRRRFTQELATTRIARNDKPAKWNEVLSWLDQNTIIESEDQKNTLRRFWENEIPEKAGEDIDFNDLMNALFLSPLNLHAYLLADNNIVGDKLFQDVEGVSYLDSLVKLTLPCMYISGEYDTNITPQIAEDALLFLGTPIESKSHIIIPNATHDMPYEYPHITNKHIKEFVERFK